jgi:L-cysteine S-thiosulfotransferase
MKKILIAALFLCGSADAQDRNAAVQSGVTEIEAMREMMRGFNPRGQAQLDRLVQDDVQRFCSTKNWSKDKAAIAKLEKQQLAQVKYPADGKLMGDWRRGESVAQRGQGMQYSDNPKNPSGGNCYACHQLSPKEVSYGTIGPSLRNFGKTRGSTEAIQRYAYGKIYNSQAYTACSNMPRFGHAGILTEAQIKDLVALLLDPQSPVNQ